MVVFLARDEAGGYGDFELVVEVVVQQESVACVPVESCIDVQLRHRLLQTCFGGAVEGCCLVCVGGDLDDPLGRLLLLSVCAVSQLLALGFESVGLAVTPLAGLVQSHQIRIRFKHNFLGFLFECLG